MQEDAHRSSSSPSVAAATGLRGRKGRIEPRLHDPSLIDGRIFYDAELDVLQGYPHQLMAYALAEILRSLAPELGLRFVSDHPIWYLDPDTDAQRIAAPDLVLTVNEDISRITAEELLLVIEVVTTSDRRKEIKDTRTQKRLNEFNAVQEFALCFPDVDDPRSLIWYQLRDDGVYEEFVLSAGAEVASHVVPGLSFRVKPREDWQLGQKIDVVYQGKVRLPLTEEHQRAERAEQERARAEQERARERARVEELERALAEKERQLAALLTRSRDID